jgi:hypothetical protein
MKNYKSLYFILPILYVFITYIYHNKITKEEDFKAKELSAQNVIKDYIINSKNLFMNNNINEEYLQKLMVIYDNHTNNLRICRLKIHILKLHY